MTRNKLKFRLQRAWSDARRNLIDSKFIKRKDLYDKRITLNVNSFKKGDLLLLRNNPSNKLEELFKGPYSVVKDEYRNLVIKIDNKEDGA